MTANIYDQSEFSAKISFDTKTTNFKYFSYYFAFVSVPNIFPAKFVEKRSNILEIRDLNWHA